MPVSWARRASRETERSPRPAPSGHCKRTSAAELEEWCRNRPDEIEPAQTTRALGRRNLPPAIEQDFARTSLLLQDHLGCSVTCCPCCFASAARRPAAGSATWR